MDPLFRGATHVLVDFQTSPMDLASGALIPGQVLLYRDDRNQEWVCHRYLGERNGQTFLKGDRNTTLEAVVKPVIWGVVRGVKFPKRIQSAELRLGRELLCRWQLAQCEKRGYLSKKFYRYSALVLLWLNKVVSTR